MGLLSCLRGVLLSQVIFLAWAAAMFTGCGMTKNLDEMHDSTSQMSTTTREMDQKMDQLTEMNKRMGDMTTQMTTMTSLMGQMTEMNSAMHDMKDAMGTMITTLTGMNQQMSVMPKMADSLVHIQDVIGQLDTMMASLDKKMDELPKMSKTMTGMSTQVGSMNKQLTGLRGDLKTLKDMYAALQGLSSKMDHVDTVATNGIVDAVHGVADGTRTSELDKMEKAENLGGKFPHAAAYLFAYDYQLVFRGVEESGQANEDKLRADAVQDFFFHMNNYVENDKPIDVMTHDQKLMDLMVIAGALDMIDSNTMAKLKKINATRPYPFLSMWGMIEYALDRKALLNREDPNDDPALNWENLVLTNEPFAVYLGQIRLNIEAAIVAQNLSKLPDNPEPWTFTSAWQKVLGASYSVAGWTGKISSLNAAQIADAANTLSQANETKDFLSKHGYDTRLQWLVKQVLANCEIDTAPPGSPAKRNAALARLKAERDKFVQ